MRHIETHCQLDKVFWFKYLETDSLSLSLIFNVKNRGVTIQMKKRKRGGGKNTTKESKMRSCVCLGGERGLQSLAGVLDLTAAAASVLCLKVVP